MRVEARREAGAAVRSRPAGFEAALRRAAAHRAPAARGPASHLNPLPVEETGGGEGPGRAAAWDARGGAGVDAASREAGREGPAQGSVEAGRGAGEAEVWVDLRGMAEAASPVPVPLARAVAQVAPAVEAFWREGRAALSLDFGRALGLELRSEGGAVALALRAPPDLLAAARAAVPGMVAAVAVRGIPVVRAEVRQRGSGLARRGR